MYLIGLSQFGYTWTVHTSKDPACRQEWYTLDQVKTGQPVALLTTNPTRTTWHATVFVDGKRTEHSSWWDAASLVERRIMPHQRSDLARHSVDSSKYLEGCWWEEIATSGHVTHIGQWVACLLDILAEETHPTKQAQLPDYEWKPKVSDLIKLWETNLDTCQGDPQDHLRKLILNQRNLLREPSASTIEDRKNGDFHRLPFRELPMGYQIAVKEIYDLKPGFFESAAVRDKLRWNGHTFDITSCDSNLYWGYRTHDATEIVFVARVSHALPFGTTIGDLRRWLREFEATL